MKHILLCVDGSNYGVEACKYTAWLARRNQAQVSVLYVSDLRQFELPVVADLSGSLGVQPYQGITTQLQEMEKEKAKAIEQQVNEVMESVDYAEDTTFFHKTGLLMDCIEAMQEEADLVVVGKRGENANFETEHLGSRMERIVRSSKRPVWVTSRKFREIRRLVFAYDGGPSCQKALDFLKESESLKGLDLHVLSVVEHDDNAEVQQALQDVESELLEADFEPVCQMLIGEPETAIAQYVSQQEMDMLIMGAYGHNRIRYLLIGSTTTEMIRRCQIPVLCFR
jgi:nucleotide-binding universal stress UspA family protein